MTTWHFADVCELSAPPTKLINTSNEEMVKLKKAFYPIFLKVKKGRERGKVTDLLFQPIIISQAPKFIL